MHDATYDSLKAWADAHLNDLVRDGAVGRILELWNSGTAADRDFWAGHGWEHMANLVGAEADVPVPALETFLVEIEGVSRRTFLVAAPVGNKALAVERALDRFNRGEAGELRASSYGKPSDPVPYTNEVLGKRYKGYDGKIYMAESYDGGHGYWMLEEGTANRRNVSERAIGGTFHRIRD